MKQDKYRGCLIGGAVGDALGYAVEFNDIDEIINTYGEPGITEYELTGGVAQISDDTQMTLFTAAGLLFQKEAEPCDTNENCISSIWNCYREWLCTQFERFPLDEKLKYTWLSDIPELFSSRAPGGTCIDALANNEPGTLETPVNDSKGCGGVMRVAPVALYFDSSNTDIKTIDTLGAEAAALTHGHQLGWLPAAALVHVIARIVHEDYSIADAVKDMQVSMKEQFGHLEDTAFLMKLVDKAAELAAKAGDDKAAIIELGEGWVAEETLAIAIYCALKYSDDFEQAVTAAVNHSGDSDSTGAVAGNIVGASLGIGGIPARYLADLELKDVIMKVAEDLYGAANHAERYIMDTP